MPILKTKLNRVIKKLKKLKKPTEFGKKSEDTRISK